MMLEAGLVGARFAHFACAIILLGSALFGLYSHPYGSQSMCLARPSPTILSAVALGALLSGLAWFLFTVGNMSGTLAALTTASGGQQIGCWHETDMPIALRGARCKAGCNGDHIKQGMNVRQAQPQKHWIAHLNAKLPSAAPADRSTAAVRS
jgi:hypothetical protein